MGIIFSTSFLKIGYRTFNEFQSESMNLQDVTLEIIASRGPVITVRTGEGPLSSVDANVRHAVKLALKAFTTERAQPAAGR